MAVEIERKFLVDKSRLPKLEKGVRLAQGYLETAPGNVVRVRTADDKAFLTVKGKTENYSRLEFEYEIPHKDALELLDKLCEKPIIEKTRYIQLVGGKKWEIDVFDRENTGLIVAEIELLSEDEKFELPDWALREVSHLKEYRNNFLAQNPYSTWKSDF
jgi:adenylate cyclase